MFSLKKNFIWIIMLIVIILLSFAIYQCSRLSQREGMTVTNENLEFIKDNVEGKKLYNGFYYFPLSGSIVSSGENNATKITRDGEISNHNVSSGEKITINGELSKSYKSWDLPPVTANEHLYYIPFGESTYMHVVDYSKLDGNSKYNYGYFAANNGVVTQTTYNVTKDVIIKPEEEGSNDYADSLTNDIAQAGQQKVHKVYPYVYYNMSNGDLYLKNANNEFDMFNRDGNNITAPSTGETIENRTTSWMKTDDMGGNLVIYVPHQRKTLIIVLHKNSDGENTRFDMVQVCRFAKNMVIETLEDDEKTTSQPDANDDEKTQPDISDVTGNQKISDHSHSMAELVDLSNNISDYYKWYWYWNSSGSLPVHFSEDYMLKTQMVPPVCPACPSCNNGGCCTNCGGNGGSGTVDGSGNSIVNEKNEKNRPVSDAYNKTLDTATDLLKSGGSGATNLVRDTASGATNLARDTASGVGNFAKDAAGNTVDLGKEIVGETVGLGKDVVGGTVGLGKDIVGGTVGLGKDIVGGTADFVSNLGSGAVDVLKTNQHNNNYQQLNNLQGGQTMTMGQMNNFSGPTGPTDPYTYNGKLQQRPTSNFIPRTADFSAFAK